MVVGKAGVLGGRTTRDRNLAVDSVVIMLPLIIEECFPGENGDITGGIHIVGEQSSVEGSNVQLHTLISTKLLTVICNIQFLGGGVVQNLENSGTDSVDSDFDHAGIIEGGSSDGSQSVVFGGVGAVIGIHIHLEGLSVDVEGVKLAALEFGEGDQSLIGLGNLSSVEVQNLEVFLGEGLRDLVIVVGNGALVLSGQLDHEEVEGGLENLGGFHQGDDKHGADLAGARDDTDLAIGAEHSVTLVHDGCLSLSVLEDVEGLFSGSAGVVGDVDNVQSRGLRSVGLFGDKVEGGGKVKRDGGFNLIVDEREELVLAILVFVDVKTESYDRVTSNEVELGGLGAGNRGISLETLLDGESLAVSI